MLTVLVVQVGLFPDPFQEMCLRVRGVLVEDQEILNGR